MRPTQHDGRRSRALDQEGLGECEWRDTCGSDVPPLDVVESLTWIERKVSLSMGHGRCTGEAVALAGGRGTARDSRRGARAHVSVKEIYFPSDWEEGSLTFMILSRSSTR